MPEILFFARPYEGIIQPQALVELDETVQQRFRTLPVDQDTAVLIPIRVPVYFANGKDAPFVRIEGSIEMQDEDLVAIADHFVEVIDVSIRFPWGPMVFREKGKRFGKECISNALLALREKHRLSKSICDINDVSPTY